MNDLHLQWNELDRILQLDADINGSARAPPSLWTDAWRLYEDVCLACAGLLTGRPWRSRHGSEESWAEAEEYGLASGPVRVRTHGEGIEGRPMTIPGSPARSRSFRRASERTFPEPWTAAPSTQGGASQDIYKDDDDDDDDGYDEAEEEEEGEDGHGTVLVRDRQSRTTLALLQTFHAQTRFWLSRLAALLPPHTDHNPETAYTDAPAPPGHGDAREDDRGAEMVVQLAPRDVLELELSPLSSLDARFVEWLAEEYGASHAHAGVRVFVKRGWRDLLGLVFAVGGAPSSSSSASS